MMNFHHQQGRLGIWGRILLLDRIVLGDLSHLEDQDGFD